MIELPPKISKRALNSALVCNPDDAVDKIIEDINSSYDYWSKVKYKPLPDGYTAEDIWTLVKASRIKKRVEIWEGYPFWFSLTDNMMRQCYTFDHSFGLHSNDFLLIDDNMRVASLMTSLMEEAISSSQMEGASTTRRIAKEMLRNREKPRDKSQRMIFNNYQAIQFISENRDTPLSQALLLQIHSLLTLGTLSDSQDEGRFRTNDDVVVENGTTHEVVHTPPSHSEIQPYINLVCRFFNEDLNTVFIHPIIRGIIIHFMIGYIHPFVDGNGRTARALFYWYMLRQGYHVTEHLSISRIIMRKKIAYEKAYLYTENDDMDLGYFIQYNLDILLQSVDELHLYLQRKQNENQATRMLVRIDGINERQAQILKLIYDNPQEMLTVKDVQGRMLVSPTTAKGDLIGLVHMGLLSEIELNKVKRGYIKGEKFDFVISNN